MYREEVCIRHFARHGVQLADPSRAARGRLRGRAYGRRRLRTPPAVIPFTGERIFMRHHDMWVPALGLGAGLSGVIGSVSRGTCTILQANFAEDLFRGCMESGSRRVFRYSSTHEKEIPDGSI
jgi:hypothetical protein